MSGFSEYIYFYFATKLNIIKLKWVERLSFFASVSHFGRYRKIGYPFCPKQQSFLSSQSIKNNIAKNLIHSTEKTIIDIEHKSSSINCSWLWCIKFLGCPLYARWRWFSSRFWPADILTSATSQAARACRHQACRGRPPTDDCFRTCTKGGHTSPLLEQWNFYMSGFNEIFCHI